MGKSGSLIKIAFYVIESGVLLLLIRYANMVILIGLNQSQQLDTLDKSGFEFFFFLAHEPQAALLSFGKVKYAILLLPYTFLLTFRLEKQLSQ